MVLKWQPLFIGLFIVLQHDVRNVRAIKANGYFPLSFRLYLGR